MATNNSINQSEALPVPVTVAKGGTGLTTITTGNLLVGANGSNPTLLAPSTAGKMVVSNGTTFVTSTPTFPNASATSGKIIKSDGTNWVASTETYAAPGTSGNILTSNGTNWTSTAPTASFAPKTRYSTIFEDYARFVDNDSGGTSSVSTLGLSLATTATATRSAGVYWQIGSDSNDSFANSPMISMSIACLGIGTTGTGVFGCGDMGLLTRDHFGFVIKTVGGVSSLYASNANGTTQTESAALTTIAASDNIDLCARINGTSSIDFYWSKNGGAWSAATNHTTNLPSLTGAGAIIGFFKQTNGSGDFITYVYNYTYER